MDREQSKQDGETQAQAHPASRDEVSALVSELAGLARNAPDRLTERVRALSIRQQAELALRLPAKERMELMLHAPKPMRLVRSLPDSEFYLTVREIGPTDALPLLALASSDQLTHVLDLESWRHQRFDPKRAGAWVALLIEAGEPVVRRVLRSTDDEMLTLLFQQWVRVTPIELDEGGGVELHSVHRPETGDERGIVSPDGAYRFSPIIPEHTPAVQQLARIFYRSQRARFDRILWSAVYEMPADLEEQTLQWRSSRLEEHGFPPWEEALSVYAPPAGVRVHPQPLRSKDADALQAPHSPLRILSSGGVLGRILEELPDEAREGALHELISVANRLLVANAADTGDPEAHRATVRTAAGYIDIALEARGADGSPEAIAVLREIPLIELFREGYTRAAKLQKSARNLMDQGWASAHPNSLELLDSPVRERIKRLLDTRPNYLEILEDGRMAARPFRRQIEIDETRVALEMASLIGRLMVEHLGLDVEQAMEQGAVSETETPRFSAYLLTLLAWHSTRSALRGDPLPPDVATDFLREIASARTAPPQAAAEALETLLQKMALSFALTETETTILRSFGRAALERLSAECGSMDPSIPVDSRFVNCLLVEVKES